MLRISLPGVKELDEDGCCVFDEVVLVSEDVICSRGIFEIRYCKRDMPAENTFGDVYFGNCKRIVVSFYENGLFLFAEEIMCPSAGIVTHGDGLTKEGTFFTICKDQKLGIYNMNNKFIKNVYVGGDFFAEFKRVNENYAIGLGQEGCTGDSFTGLFNLNILFGIGKTEIVMPNNSRVHFPIIKYDEPNYLAVAPIAATENGFEVIILKEGHYPWINNNIVSYDDVFNKIANFYNKSKK